MMADVKASGSTSPTPHSDDIAYITQYLDAVGLDDVLHKVYSLDQSLYQFQFI